MYECHLQVVYYFINFQLGDSQFPSVDQNSRKEKGRRNRDRPSLLAAIFLSGCHADVSENNIIFAGNQRTPANITATKMERYGTGLT